MSSRRQILDITGTSLEEKREFKRLWIRNQANPPMSGFELPPVAINNTWKKREGKEEGRETEEIWDLGFFGILFCFSSFINPLQG